MNVALSRAVRNARLKALADAIDGAAPKPGQLLLFGGTRPPVMGTPAPEALQCAVALAWPCGTVADQALTFTPGREGQRNAAGTITWGRFVDGNGTPVLDADAGLVGSGQAIQLDSVAGYAGAFVRLASGLLSE